MTPTAPDASTEAATSELSGQAGEEALKASAQNLPPKGDDFSVSDSESATEAKPARKPKAKPKVEESEPEPAPTPKARTYSGKGQDEVIVTMLELGAPFRKSLSVVHLQRRLGELGYHEATADVSGYAGALTASSVAHWQTDNKFPVGPVTNEQASALFKGDKAVHVVLDRIE